MRFILLIFSCLFTTLILSQASQNPPYLFPSSVLPVPIYSTSPIKLITKVTTSHWATRINTGFTVNASAYSVNLESCYGYGISIPTAPRDFIDTFKIGTLSPGTYTAYFKPQISYSLTVCNVDTFSTANFTFQVLEGIDPIDVGINESKVDQLNFTFLPNPVLDELEINFNQQEQHPIHFQLFDLFGQVVYEERFITNHNKKKIDVSFLQSGVYYLQFKNGTSELVKKLIKN